MSESGQTEKHSARADVFCASPKNGRWFKRVGYLKNTRAAQADWDAFARDLAPEFFDEVRQAPIDI
jgi:hypothetical protein